MSDYASARSYAQAIRVAVQTRRMPPFAADNTGLCGTWEDARWLAGTEIDTLVRWQESGAPEGSPPRSGAQFRAGEAGAQFRADAVASIGGVYRPGLGAGGNRCFVVDPGLERDRLLDAIRVRSGDARAVAQVTLFALDSAAAEAQAAALDDGDAGLGYGCFGGARADGARLVASWTWPDPVLRMPAGTGVRLRAGRKLVAQIHYDISLTGSAFASDTNIELEFDDGAREARILSITAMGTLPPGQRYAAVETTQPVERRMKVVGIAPLMHVRGSTMRLEVEGGRCLAEFDHWHFNSQQLFRAREPAAVEPGDRLHLSCAYSTLGRPQPMRLGEAADEEECSARLWVTD
jgi:hypothetical protein